MTRRTPIRGVAMLAAILLALLLSAPPVIAENEAELRARLDATLKNSGPGTALVEAEAAIRERPDSPTAWGFKAYALQRLGQFLEAAAAYGKAAELHPKQAWARANLADVLASLERFDEAVEAAEKAVALEPKNTAVHVMHSWVLRRAGDYAGAAVAAERAMVSGVDPVWCHSELAYLTWVLGSPEESRAHWQRARELGLPEEEYRHGMKVLKWDERAGRTSGGAPAGDGAPSVYRIGRLDARTRIGPRLPADLSAMLTRLQGEYARFFDLPDDEGPRITLVLSRTLEEHERFRVALFAQGPVDKGFLHRPGAGGPGGTGFDLSIYIALPEPGLEQRLSHELAHAFLSVRLPNARQLSPWLDEGLATWLEIRSQDQVVGPGTLRTDLLDELVKAKRDASLLPFDVMLVASQAEFVGPFARVRYAEAWSMIHFLLEGLGPGGRGRLKKLLDAMDRPMWRGTNPLESACGLTTAELSAAFDRHLSALLAKR